MKTDPHREAIFAACGSRLGLLQEARTSQRWHLTATRQRLTATGRLLVHAAARRRSCG